MNVYVYRAALWCEDCGKSIRDRLIADGKAPDDPDDESSYDSDDFPKGPYPDGGGEADSVQHCDAGEDCINAEVFHDGRKVGCMLENDLTSEGVASLLESAHEHYHGKRSSPVVAMWIEYYSSCGIQIPDADDTSCGCGQEA